MDIIGDGQMQLSEKKIFRQPGEAAIKKYHPEALTPVPFQENEVKDYG
jgi:hypothetical protein